MVQALIEAIAQSTTFDEEIEDDVANILQTMKDNRHVTQIYYGPLHFSHIPHLLQKLPFEMQDKGGRKGVLQIGKNGFLGKQYQHLDTLKKEGVEYEYYQILRCKGAPSCTRKEEAKPKVQQCSFYLSLKMKHYLNKPESEHMVWITFGDPEGRHDECEVKKISPKNTSDMSSTLTTSTSIHPVMKMQTPWNLLCRENDDVKKSFDLEDTTMEETQRLYRLMLHPRINQISLASYHFKQIPMIISALPFSIRDKGGRNGNLDLGRNGFLGGDYAHRDTLKNKEDRYEYYQIARCIGCDSCWTKCGNQCSSPKETLQCCPHYKKNDHACSFYISFKVKHEPGEDHTADMVSIVFGDPEKRHTAGRIDEHPSKMQRMASHVQQQLYSPARSCPSAFPSTTQANPATFNTLPTAMDIALTTLVLTMREEDLAMYVRNLKWTPFHSMKTVATTVVEARAPAELCTKIEEYQCASCVLHGPTKACIAIRHYANGVCLLHYTNLHNLPVVTIMQMLTQQMEGLAFPPCVSVAMYAVPYEISKLYDFFHVHLRYLAHPKIPQYWIFKTVSNDIIASAQLLNMAASSAEDSSLMVKFSFEPQVHTLNYHHARLLHSYATAMRDEDENCYPAAKKCKKMVDLSPLSILSQAVNGLLRQ